MGEPLLGWLPLFEQGLAVTVALSIVSASASTLVGIPVALALDANGTWIQRVAKTYSAAIRGIPPILVLFGVFFGLPTIGLQIDAFPAAVIAMTVYGAAYMGEIFRAGLRAVPAGQHEAARALGLTNAYALRRVYVPQALSVISPPFVNELTELVKDTALASVIGVRDMSDVANSVTSITYQPLQIFAVTAAVYGAIISGLLIFQELSAKRLWRAGR